MSEDPYAFLEVPRDASPAVIEAAYRKLIAEIDAEKDPALQRAGEHLRGRAEAAYAILSDPARRAESDGGGGASAEEDAAFEPHASSILSSPSFWIRAVWGTSLLAYAVWEFLTGTRMRFDGPYENLIDRAGLMPFHIVENALRGIPGRRVAGPEAFLDAVGQVFLAVVAYAAPYDLLIDALFRPRWMRRRALQGED